VKRTIRIGVCGWSYPDWRGVVYPQRRPKGFSELGHVASFVDAVELNVSFYRPPTPAMSEGWLRQVTARPDFRFTAKLWQRFTHDREGAWTEAEARSFKDGLRPLREAGRLEALLAQFPWSFRPTEGNLDRLRRVADSFGEWPCVVEVRNAEWQTPETIEFLRDLGLGFCNIDQPRSRQGLAPTSMATSPVAYYRFHGRNARAWFNREAGRDERYDYLYTDRELAGWVGDIVRMAERADRVFVMTNNHYRGQAMVNALQMKAALSGEKVSAPPSLVSAYPVLKPIIRPPAGQAALPWYGADDQGP